MPEPAFTLSLPAEEPFRGLLGEAVRVYLRVTGTGGASDPDAFVATVVEAAERVSSGGAEIQLEVAVTSLRVDVRLTCGSATQTLSYSLAPAGG